MHELSVCYALMQQVEQLAAQHQALGVAKITVQIGALSGVEPELLNSAFTIAQAGTIAAQAELSLETIPITVRCQSCGAESEVTLNCLLCKTCGDWQTRLISGNELLLKQVEFITAADV